MSFCFKKKMLILINMISIAQIEMIDVESIDKGDHIFRCGAFMENSILTHHGIYVGNNEVIHFSGGGDGSGLEVSIKDAKIKKVSINDFLMNKYKCLRIVSKHDKTATLRRAYSELGDNFGGYNPANNNCEHFANWCRTGRKYSIQVDIISKISKYVLKNRSDYLKKLTNNAKDFVKIFPNKMLVANTIIDTLDYFIE